MNNNKNNNPRKHLSMLTRTLLESTEGDDRRVTRVLQRLSRCKTERAVRLFLSQSGVYPGEHANVTNESLDIVLSYFTEHQEQLAKLDLEIEDVVETETHLFLDRSEEDTVCGLPAQKVNW